MVIENWLHARGFVLAPEAPVDAETDTALASA